ncbi:hypothetical protein DSL72_002485 [Monilinia vaccinii-corymbosi]|uniref:Thiamine pyrophosphate enzyme TPP-binding domain-containing protein n=1 Tax=Monilinia vaccinii-corymbosi TaxID=61207 RepID=A0A8A3PCS3_9HELO|nr:hypothetical protein DSL72_002485 [Monilinia vaccinii-corymbosi]
MLPSKPPPSLPSTSDSRIQELSISPDLDVSAFHGGRLGPRNRAPPSCHRARRRRDASPRRRHAQCQHGARSILIFAGLCPYSEAGSLLGARTEYQHWLQDAPDQKSIVRQYCRYVGEFRTAETVKQTVARALQFAKSDPKGPVYLAGAREVMAESLESRKLDVGKYGPTGPGALPLSAVRTIVQALLEAKSPLVITGYSGRNHSCPDQLVQLSDLIQSLQINEYLKISSRITKASPVYEERERLRVEKHKKRPSSIAALAISSPDRSLDIHHVGATLRDAVPKDTVFVVEAATCAMALSDQLQVNTPGSWLNSGGAGLGWSGGAAMGVKLAYDAAGTPKFVCQVVGDGTYLFSVPGSVYWTASSTITIVARHFGWNAPHQSHKLVHLEGAGSRASNKDMYISLEPSPDYSGIAKAAAGENFGSLKGSLYAAKVANTEDLNRVLDEAVKEVRTGRGAVVEVVLNVD